jgi:CheY-like chemotaxis protein
MPITPDLRGLHLLLVEDEYLLALGLAEVATDLGAEVFGPVASVDDALALVEKLPELDAAILDVNLGDATIFPVADALRARGVPFVFSTASEPTAFPERFRDVPLCRKPFDFATFRLALGSLRRARAA